MVTMLTIFLSFSAFLVGLALVWRLAYRAGFAEGRSTIPLHLIRALAKHRVSCDGEAPQIVAADLGEALLLPPDEIRRLQEIRPEVAEKTPAPGKLRPAS